MITAETETVSTLRKLSTNDILAIVLSLTLGLAAIIVITLLVIKCRKQKVKAND
jgi:hypothetical protein